MIVGLCENGLVLTSKRSGSLGLMLTHYKIVGVSMNNDTMTTYEGMAMGSILQLDMINEISILWYELGKQYYSHGMQQLESSWKLCTTFVKLYMKFEKG